MTRRTTVRTLVLGGLAVLLATAPVDAQDRRDRRQDGRSRQELEQRFRAQMKRMIQEELGLSDDESTRLDEIMASFQTRRRELARSERATRRDVEALMSQDAPDQAEAARLLQRMQELRVEEDRLFEEEQAALLEVLTPVQVLQLHALRDRVADRLRSMRGRRGDDGRDRRRGGLP